MKKRLIRTRRMFNVSRELREQIVNIIDDLVDKIAPGYLPPNSIFPLNYRTTIYKEIYKYLWREFGRRRFENAHYRDEIFDFLRDVPSEKFFNVTEHLLKVMFEIVHIQIAIPDDIVLNPHAGNKQWSRMESVRGRHISLFKWAVDALNHRLSQNNAPYHYELGDEFVQMVRVDRRSGVPEENRSIQEKDDSQTSHHQNQSRSEFWNRRLYFIAVGGVILTFLDFAFGDRILIRLFHCGAELFVELISRLKEQGVLK